eukprot:g59672.t1
MHLGSGRLNCYVADRMLNVIAAGLQPVSNNPCCTELLNHSEAVHVARTPDLCKTGLRARYPSLLQTPHGRESLLGLMEQIALCHTYMSRFTMLLHALL